MGMTKYDRLLYILNLLRSRRTLNAARLAEECGVTERSIYRDIISLSEANIPIYYDNGYKLASDNFLPAFNFNFEEYTCLKLALESSPLTETGKYAEVLKQVRAKVDSGLSDITREKKKTARSVARIDIDTTQAHSNPERIYGIIEDAVNNQTCVAMDYETIEHGMTHRVVEPYFIVFRGRAFYFVARCRLREDLRTFRVDRVRDVQTTGEYFARAKDVNAESYFDGSWRLYGGDSFDVEVLFSGKAARVVANGVHHPREEIETVNEHTVRYRVTVNGYEEILRWILGFGDEAEVLAPLEMRRELAEVARRLLGMYAST